MGPAAWAGAWHCYQGKHRDRGQVTRRQVLLAWLLVKLYFQGWNLEDFLASKRLTFMLHVCASSVNCNPLH